MDKNRLIIICASLLFLTACDQLGIESLAAKSTREKAEGDAVGSACRHAGRALEDCYALNPDMSKAAIFDGWKSMNDYMRENKIAEITPHIARNTPPVAATEEGKAKMAESAVHNTAPEASQSYQPGGFRKKESAAGNDELPHRTNES